MGKTIIVKGVVALNKATPFFYRYTIEGWGYPAGEIYDLKNGQYLALANSRSSGYSRRVCKSVGEARRWIAKKVGESFPCNELKFETETTSIEQLK